MRSYAGITIAETLAETDSKKAAFTMIPRVRTSSHLRPCGLAVLEAIASGELLGTAEAKLTDLAGKLYGHATISCAIVAPRA
ncbi:MAG: hypothetical protein PVSMB8_06430 [Vulcanimicrobiaceae bacterium]